MASVGGKVDRRIAINVHVVEVGTVIEQKSRDGWESSICRHTEGRPAPPIFGVDIHANMDQVGHLLQVAIAGSLNDGSVFDHDSLQQPTHGHTSLRLDKRPVRCLAILWRRQQAVRTL
ncbi:hypothetical protein BN1708_009893 [Verticillium longisporum]|uniref:Uncharacterized protein n=1 Tax=Verticillium longisporum TaxID=100787 RepID=A0A0G4KLV8_VERLO|nr:hypothetical protein BN1708_009893 [Verticillium longisporum]